jgi:hypothetical protein
VASGVSANATVAALALGPKQIPMSVIGNTICRFVAPDGLMRYSVRQRSDGLFVVVHDGANRDDGSQPYWMEDRVLSGLFGSAELAETELKQRAGDSWTREM